MLSSFISAFIPDWNDLWLFLKDRRQGCRGACPKRLFISSVLKTKHRYNVFS